MLSKQQKSKLVILLECCSSVVDNVQRGQIIQRLPSEVSCRIVRGTTLRSEVTSIVDTCNGYQNGIKDLFQSIYWFEGPSFASRMIRQFLTSIEVTDVADVLDAIDTKEWRPAISSMGSSGNDEFTDPDIPSHTEGTDREHTDPVATSYAVEFTEPDTAILSLQPPGRPEQNGSEKTKLWRRKKPKVWLVYDAAYIEAERAISVMAEAIPVKIPAAREVLWDACATLAIQLHSAGVRNHSRKSLHTVDTLRIPQAELLLTSAASSLLRYDDSCGIYFLNDYMVPFFIANALAERMYLFDPRIPVIVNTELVRFIRSAMPYFLEWGKLDFKGASLQRADLRHASLSKINMRESDLRMADLSESKLRESDLWKSNLQGALLCGVDLRCANLSGADLRNTNLSNANLEGCDLSEARLDGADLKSANLQGASLFGADLNDSQVGGVRVSSTFQVPQQLVSATADSTPTRSTGKSDAESVTHLHFHGSVSHVAIQSGSGTQTVATAIGPKEADSIPQTSAQAIAQLREETIAIQEQLVTTYKILLGAEEQRARIIEDLQCIIADIEKRLPKDEAFSILAMKKATIDAIRELENQHAIETRNLHELAQSGVSQSLLASVIFEVVKFLSPL